MVGTVELAVVGLTGSGIGTALAVPMVWPRTARSLDVRLMGACLLALSAVAALISLRVMGLVPGAPAIDHVVNLLGFSAYPMAYLYVRQQTRPAALARDAWWLWAPALAYAAVLVVKSALAMDTRVPFAWVLPVAIGFTALCASLLRGRAEHRQNAIVPAEGIVVFLVVLNIAQTVRWSFGHLSPIRALVPLVPATGFVALVALVVWRSLPPAQAVAAAVPAPRYEKSGLGQDAAMALLARINETLLANRVFADAGLTLAGLAAAVDSTPHQVSEVLNRYANITFHEWLNRHRVADVKAQLLDASADRFTIEGIGASAGFGSRSALYAAFRRLEGMTPAEFRAARDDKARSQT